MYPRKFARQIVKYLQQDRSKPEEVVFADGDHPTKRRRLGNKLSPAAIQHRFPDINWQTVMTQVGQLAPRVGTMVIETGKLVDQVKEMCPSHEVKHLVLCRGMERYLGPNCNIPRGSAPLRRIISFQRKTNELHVDEEWALWEHLSYRGLRRKCVPSRIGLTIFASTKMPNIDVPVEPSADVPIPIRERPGVKKGLEELGFLVSPFNPCVFVLQNPQSGVTEGLIGIHVDDCLCCGSPLFHEKLKSLEKKFPFGSRKSRNFTFTGLHR